MQGRFALLWISTASQVGSLFFCTQMSGLASPLICWGSFRAALGASRLHISWKNRGVPYTSQTIWRWSYALSRTQQLSMHSKYHAGTTNWQILFFFFSFFFFPCMNCRTVFHRTGWKFVENKSSSVLAVFSLPSKEQWAWTWLWPSYGLWAVSAEFPCWANYLTGKAVLVWLLGNQRPWLWEKGKQQEWASPTHPVMEL